MTNFWGLDVLYPKPLEEEPGTKKQQWIMLDLRSKTLSAIRFAMSSDLHVSHISRLNKILKHFLLSCTTLYTHNYAWGVLFASFEISPEKNILDQTDGCIGLCYQPQLSSHVARMKPALNHHGIWPNHKNMHQPRFPWNKGISITKLPFWGPTSCFRSLEFG